MLIIICGLPGSGKSHLSKELAKRFSAAHINSDVIRKKLFGTPSYTEEEKRLVYEAMIEEAGKALQKGRNVILDATFYRAEYRKMAKETAGRAGTDSYIIMCEIGEGETERRMMQRKKGKGLSDADFEVYLKLKETFEPIEGRHLRIDCTLSRKEILRAVENFIGAY